MNKEKWIAAWKAFLHWPGWTAWLKWKGWRAIGHWPGWKTLFVIHPALAILLAVGSGVGLGWVFLSGGEDHWLAIPVYVLSAYALIAVCVGIPGFIRRGHGFVNRYTLTSRYVHDKDFRFTVSLYLEQLINAFYGIFKTASGAVLGSAWIGADGLYNLAQAVIQLIQILRRKKNLDMMRQWKSYRFCGWLILLMHLTVVGLVFQMTRMGRLEEYPGVQIFATAAFAFYKLITAVIDVAKDRKNKAPIDSSVMLLDLAQALFSIYSLQVAMIHQFGGSARYAALMNNLTGTAVCAMIMGMGIYMLRRSRREMKKLEEPGN